MRTIARHELAGLIDHTLLAPEATAGAVETLCAEGVDLGVGAICVSPTMVSVAVASLPSGFTVASVVGFPSGAHEASVKAREAELARDHGAREIDMVVNLGAVMDGRWAAVTDEIGSVRRAVGVDVIVKVIVESAALDDEQIVAACTAAVDAGADFVKTSTGFHKSGGATTHAVRLMRDTVGPLVGVKASGGIRTLKVALGMIDAGATRLGTSSARAILEEAARTNLPGNS